MEFIVIITVEAKDECADGEGRLPSDRELANVASDRLRDETRGDFELPWMVRDVRPHA
jgi:hypothetical protein